jgi:pSer/pThr/pTyr-binding forkhead associated (FHA) protein
VAERGGVHLIDREKLVLLCQQKNLTIPSLTALQTKSGHVLSLTQQVTTFGKASGNTLICAHPSVSKHHAVLERSGLYLFIKDCGSTNGTFVNEHKLGKFAVLNYGDVIRLGAVSMCVILKPKTGNQS